MNWNNYIQLATRTESVPDINLQCTDGQRASSSNVHIVRLLHAALGVCTEVAELYDGHTVVNKLEELGDILWYLAIADTVMDWSSTHYDVDMAKPALFYIGEIQDVLKRHIFYKKPLDEAMMQRLDMSFLAIKKHVMADLEMSGLPLEDCCRANIMKLEKRYPDKFFDAKAAIHRDVDRELEHISETGEVMIIGATPAMVGELEVRPYTLELGDSEDAQLAEVVKQRQGQSTIPVDIDELIVEAEVGLSQETIMETFFPLNQVQLSFQGFNDLVRSLLTLGQIEKMAMDLAFVRAQQYRKMGALELARGYDAMYKSYSGKGDRLEDFSVVIMWQEAGYSLDEKQVKERLERWK